MSAGLGRRAERIRAALLGGRNQSWHGTDALRRALLLGFGLVVAGVLLHKVVAVILGSPLLIAGVLALRAKVSGEPKVKLRPVARTAEVGTAVTAVAEVDPGQGSELLVIRLPVSGHVGPGPLHLLPASMTAIASRLRREAWGEGVDIRVDHLLTGPDALLVYGPMVGVETSRVVLPPIRELPTGPVPPRAAGLVGAHRSRRPGSSTELRGIRPFQPGDRLRRIDWRVSLRAEATTGGLVGSLHVREPHAEADADVVLALDTRMDVNAELASWSTVGQSGAVRPDGSLDTAILAATALAASYLRVGDRVGLADIGRPQLGVRPGAGRRQLLRLRNQLVVCARSAGWSVRPVLNVHQAPPGALVVVLSPFLDDAVADLTMHAARRGNLVLAVDVLPTSLIPDRDDPWGEPVCGILSLKHSIRLDGLRAHGVAVLPWSDGASVAATLRQASRPRRRI